MLTRGLSPEWVAGGGSQPSCHMRHGGGVDWGVGVEAEALALNRFLSLWQEALTSSEYQRLLAVARGHAAPDEEDDDEDADFVPESDCDADTAAFNDEPTTQVSTRTPPQLTPASTPLMQRPRRGGGVGR